MRKKTKKGMLCSLLCTAISLGLVNGAAAAEQEFNFDEYVVTANRVPLKKVEVAANVTIISEEDIERGAFSKVSDILTANNVNMGTSSFASYPIVNGDDRVLIMVDGRKMNWAHLVVAGTTHAFNVDNLAVKNIERIEIVRGPNSSLYGSDAVGGIINIITKQAKENSTKVATEFGTWHSQRYTLVTEGVDKNVSYLFTYDKQRRDNFDYVDAKTGQTREFNSSEINQESANLRIDKQLENNNEVSLSLEHMQYNNGYGLNLANVDTGTVYYPNLRKQVEDFNVALTYSWNKDKGAADTIRIYRNNDEASYSNASTSYEHNLTATGGEWQQSWKISEKYLLLGGTEIRNEKVDELNSGVRTTGDMTTSAAFLENRWKLGNGYTLTEGTRYDHNSEFGGDFTSHLSLNKMLSPDKNVYVSWGQAVKNPTLKQLYADTLYWLGNKDLKPETSQTFTVGFDSKLSKNTTLQSSIYSSDLHNSIVWKANAVGSRGMYYNVNREKRQGLEVNLTSKLSEQWKVYGGYSYSQVKQKAAAGDFIVDPLTSRPNGYSLGVQYNQDKWDASLTMLAASGRNTKAYTSSSYLTLDLVTRYQLDKDTQIYFKGYNLTNEAYERLSYSATVAGKYPMPGRNISVGMERRF